MRKDLSLKQKIFWKYKLLKVIKDKIKILNLSCGKRKIKNAIGVDCIKDSDADIICDLSMFFYPFKNNAFDIRHYLCF